MRYETEGIYALFFKHLSLTNYTVHVLRKEPIMPNPSNPHHPLQYYYKEKKRGRKDK